jgi:hypothetical protein
MSQFLTELNTSMTLVTCFCHMSSVRSTSDGRGPVTRKRVPDRGSRKKRFFHFTGKNSKMEKKFFPNHQKK